MNIAIPVRTFLVVFLCAAKALAASEASATQPKTGPVTSDEDLIASFDFSVPGMAAVKAAADRHDLSAVKEAYLAFRRTASTAKYTVMPKDQPPKAVATTDTLGDEVCRHWIRNSYNFEPRAADMGVVFDWLHNPTVKGTPGYTDEWTTCVISRTPFWQTLGEAYWKTRDEKYVREWVAQLTDFAAKNRADVRGSLLWRTLDTGIRTSWTWPNVYYRCLNSPSFTADANWTFAKLIRDSGNLLANGLSFPSRTGNWVTVECGGLYTLGALFPELQSSTAWRKTAIDRLSGEADRMFPPDGFEVELTPNYHYVAMSGFVRVYGLAKLNDLPVPDAYRSKMLSMYQAPIMVMDQSGNAVSTNDSALINVAKEARDNGLKLFPDDPLLNWAASGGKRGTQPPLSSYLPYAGFYAMRGGWKPEDTFLFFRGGPTGVGHEHEDMLQITLRAGNKSLLIDPGNYAYDHSEFRRYVMNTEAHNTIIVDGKGQHRGPSKAPATQPVNNPWVISPLFDYVAATYDSGYQKNVYDGTRTYTPSRWVGDVDRSVTHTRHVLFLKPDYALLLDTLDGTGEHTFDAHFHLDAPSARIDTARQAAFSRNDGDVQLGLYALDNDHLQTDIVQGQKDPMLGWWPEQQRAIPTIRFRKTQAAPATFATFLHPYRGTEPAFTSAVLKTSDASVWTQSLHTSAEDIDVAINKSSKSAAFDLTSDFLGLIHIDAAGFVARKSRQSGVLELGGWGIRAFRSADIDFQLATPASLVWRLKDKDLQIYNAGPNPVKLMLSRLVPTEVQLMPGVWTTLSSTAGD